MAMRYEYKESIKNAVSEMYSASFVDEENRNNELDLVYAQAAKADEFEKSKYRNHVNDYKSEAFDAILKSYDEALSEGHMADEVCNIIQKYESGERNEQ